MVKLVVKIILFSVLFFIGLTFLDDQFKERRISYLDREIYKELNTNVDIAIFGSSHGMNGLDPRLLQKELGKTTYNFSSAGQRLVTTMPVIDEILRDNEVELGIVDIFPGTIGSIHRTQTKTRFFQYNTFDNIDFSLSKVIAHTRVNGIESFLQISPTIRRHSKWVNILRGNSYTYDPNSDFHNGYFSRFSFDQKIWDQKIADVLKNRDRTKPILSLTKGEKKNIDAVVARFKRKDIPVLFVSVPYYQDTLGIRTSSHQELIMEYLKEINVRFIDFNSLWEELELSQDEFTDAGHVNTKAALKVSQYLAVYIKKNYQFNKNGISESDLHNNRYAIIDNDYEDILFNKKIDSGDVLYDKGYTNVLAFNAYKDKYELLFENDRDNLGPLQIGYVYNSDPGERVNIAPNFEKFVNKDGLVSQRAFVTNQLRYKGKTYRIFQFSSPFEKIKNFELFSVEDKERKMIVSFDERHLKSSSE